MAVVQAANAQNIQGSAPVIQGSSPALQPTVDHSINQNPYRAPVAAQPAPTFTAADGSVWGSASQAAARNAAIERIGLAQEGIAIGGRAAITNLGNTYDSRNRELIGSVTTGQRNINTSLASNALNTRRTMLDIASGIRQGIRSGGVELANKNAGSSGAADALAYAYARQGNKQAGSARNQAALKTQELGYAQEDLNRQRENSLVGLTQYRDATVSQIGEDLGYKLRSLELDAQANGVPVDMGIRDRLIQQAIDRLHQIDLARDAALGGVRGLTPEEVEAQAYEMDRAGAAANPFEIGELPGLTPGGGAPISQTGIPMRRPEDELSMLPLIRREE